MHKGKLLGAVAFLGLALGASSACAQSATAVQLPNGETQFLDSNGKPLANGKVYFYTPGTTTPKTTWADPYQVTPNPDPVTLDGSGEAVIWGSGVYRQVVFDQNNVQIWDQLTGGYNCTGGSGGGSPAGSNGALQYNNSSAFGGLSLGTSTQVLHGNGSGAPTWGQVAIGSDVSGLGTGVAAALASGVTGSGNMVLATSPTISNPTIGGLLTTPGVIAAGTSVTDGGGACTASSIQGSGAGGKFVTTAGCSATSVVLAMPTATHGWACTASDITTTADSLKQSAYTVNSVTFTGTTANSDTVTYQCTGF